MKKNNILKLALNFSQPKNMEELRKENEGKSMEDLKKENEELKKHYRGLIKFMARLEKAKGNYYPELKYELMGMLPDEIYAMWEQEAISVEVNDTQH